MNTNNSQLNPHFTDQLSRWLALPTRSDDDMRRGAELLLAATHDQRLYARILANPRRMETFAVYRLRKILAVRLEGLTMAQVEEMQADVVPKVAEAMAAENKHGGRRPDHDSLPPTLKQLWEQNALRWNKIKKTYNHLLALRQALPCDRFEYVRQLKDAWYKYREDMNTYDDYQPGEGQA